MEQETLIWVAWSIMCKSHILGLADQYFKSIAMVSFSSFTNESHVLGLDFYIKGEVLILCILSAYFILINSGVYDCENAKIVYFKWFFFFF